MYLVFADTGRDIEWCREHLPSGLRYRFFSQFVPLVATWEKGAMVKGCGREGGREGERERGREGERERVRARFMWVSLIPPL